MIERPFYLEQIRPFAGKDVIKVVTGIRRSGKSTILAMVQRKMMAAGVAERDMTSIDLERYANRLLRNADELYAYLAPRIAASAEAGQTHRIFLDEVQEVAGWEKLVTGVQAESNVDIYLTGSNAHFLSSEFATYLSGRYVEFKVFPLSFAEFARACSGSGIDGGVDSLFDAYRRLGGFPLLASLGWQDEPCMAYLSDLYNTVVLKDMLEREEIGDARQLEALLPFLIANIGHTFSARSIERILRGEGRPVSVGTILSHVDIACRAHLLFKVPRTDAATKQSFKGQEKYYIADVGLRQAVYGGNDRNIDQVLENIVYLELVRHGWNVSVGRKDALPGIASPSSGAGRRTLEIDFVASKGQRSLFVQVCYLLADEATVEREFAPLEVLRSDWPKYVLSLDKVNRSRNGIIHMDLRKFLLEADSILQWEV